MKKDGNQMKFGIFLFYIKTLLNILTCPDSIEINRRFFFGKNICNKQNTYHAINY